MLNLSQMFLLQWTPQIPFHSFSSYMYHTQQNKIRYIHSGFRGHLNDAQTYQLFHQMPADCWILADSIYP